MNIAVPWILFKEESLKMRRLLGTLLGDSLLGTFLFWAFLEEVRHCFPLSLEVQPNIQIILSKTCWWNTPGVFFVKYHIFIFCFNFWSETINTSNVWWLETRLKARKKMVSSYQMVLSPIASNWKTNLRCKSWKRWNSYFDAIQTWIWSMCEDELRILPRQL